MAKISEIIKKLQELEEEYGDTEFSVYNSSTDETTHISPDDISFDEAIKDIFIEI